MKVCSINDVEDFKIATFINPYCMIDCDINNAILKSENAITEYDFCVYNAIVTTFLYGNPNHIFTPQIIYRTMTHATEGETPGPLQIEAVTKSIEKLRLAQTCIHASENTEKRISIDSEVMDDNSHFLLNLEDVHTKLGGREVSAYKILETPILYDYACLTNSVQQVPAKLLLIKNEDGSKVSNTERRISTKGYLLKQILGVKTIQEKPHSFYIAYEKLYSDISNSILSPKERRSVREYANLVLDNWVDQKFIRECVIVAQGKKYLGVRIDV